MVFLRSLCLVLLMLQAATALAAPHIENLQSRAILDAQGVLTVTETITAVMDEGGHGMFRDLPHAARLPWGAMYRRPPEVLEVLLNGTPRPTDDVEQLEGDVLRIYMRDQSRTLSAGRHTFSVTYRMPHMVGFYRDFDELNWNVVGAGWSVPVLKAAYTLRLPKGASLREAKGWVGAQDSKQRTLTGSVLSPNDSMNNDGLLEVHFSTAEALQAKEGMTCAVSWPKGVVAEPQRPVEQPLIGSVTASDLLPLGLLLLVLGYYYFTWRRVGRDPKGEAVIARFYPPIHPVMPGNLPKGRKGRGKEEAQSSPLSPAAVNFIMNDNTLDGHGLSAALLHMMSVGACVFVGDSSKEFVVSTTKTATPFAEEERIRQLVGDDDLPLNKDGGETLLEMRNAVQDMLEKSYGGLWTSNVAWVFLGIFIQACGFMGCLLYALGGIDTWSDEVLAGLLYVGVLALGMPFLMQWVRAALRHKKWLHLLWKVPTVFFLVALTPIFFVNETTNLATAASGMFWLCLLLSLTPHWLFAPIMDSPTPLGRKIKDEIEGLALYIRTAESDRFRHLNPPERTPEVFTRLLPYAVALRLEKAWGQNCAEVLEKASLSAEHMLYSPLFYERISYNLDAAISSVGGSGDSGTGGSGGRVGGGGGGGGGGFC